MILQRTNNLIYSVCHIYIRDVHGASFAELSPLMITPSKIDLRSDASHTDGGILYKNKLNVSYKGIYPAFFTDLDILLGGHYEIIVDTSDHLRFRISDSLTPMLVKSKYSRKEAKITFYNESFLPFEQLDLDQPLGNFAYNLAMTL